MNVADAQALDPAVSAVLFPVPPQHSVLRKTADAALDLIFPPHCGSCNQPLPAGQNRALCEPCARRIHWIGDDRCARCGDAVGKGAGVVPACPTCRTHPPAYIEGAAAVASYAEGPLRDLILGVKFGRQLHLIPTLAALLAQRVRQTGLFAPDLLVVPAPLTRDALHRRGFNQSRELSEQAARLLQLPYEPRLLKKVRSTPPQATLSHEQRRENLRDAFACNDRTAKAYAGRRVLLIDDVITTGSTIAECARTLHAAGLGAVFAAALARG